jgi:hypothetical protein
VLEGSFDEHMADAMHGRIDKFDVRRFVENSGKQCRSSQYSTLREGKGIASPLLVLAERSYMIEVAFGHLTCTIDAQWVHEHRVRVPPLRVQIGSDGR